MTAQMASESRLRATNWMKNGCNGFHMSNPISNPMSFWVEQDVLEYIYHFHIPIANVYGEIRAETKGYGKISENSMDMGILTKESHYILLLDVRGRGVSTVDLGAIGKNLLTVGRLQNGFLILRL